MRYYVNIITLLAVFFLLIAAGSAKAATYYVATMGNDTSAGTLAVPFRTIQKAADIAQAGDTVNVKAGVYRERVVVKNSGVAGSPITFKGEAGAVIDGGDKFTGWDPAPEIGSGVFKKTLPYFPTNATWNNKYVVVCSQGSAAGYLSLNEPSTSSDWDGVEVIVCTTNGVTYIHFRNGQDPDNEDMTLAPHGSIALLVGAKKFITVSGFTIRNAWTSISFDNSTDSIIENSTLMSGWIGAAIRNGSARVQVRNNQITLNAVYPDLGSANHRDSTHWHVWTSLYYTYESQAYGVYIDCAGSDNQIYNNHMYEHFDALIEWCTPLSYQITEATQATDRPKLAQYNQNLKVHHNHIHNNADEGLNLFGGNVGAEYHDNLIYENTKNISLRTPATGPAYFYRNRVYDISTVNEYLNPGEPSGNGIRTYAQNLPTNRGIFYFYQNSFSDGDYSLLVSSNPTDPPVVGLPNIWFFNNAFSSLRTWAAEDDATWARSGFMAAHADYNWLGGQPIYMQWAGWPKALHNVLNPDQRLFYPTTNPTFLLDSASTARQKGIDISKSFAIDGLTLSAMPGMPPGYFSGTAPDLGAVQYGKNPDPVGPSSSSQSPTPTPTPNASDTSSPVISNVAAAVSGSSVIISWILNEPATGQVAFGLGASYGTLSTLEPSFAYMSHSQTISNLTANTIYHYKVMSKDQAGNLASSGDFTFTIGGAASCVNPTPIPSGFSAPCPVFSVTPQSGSLSQNFTATITPDASKTVWTYKTLYITEGSTWKSETLPGNIQYSYWLQGQTTYNLQPTTLSLTAGTHYLASWDWTWDANAQCYKGPGASACGGGQYRIQQITIQ